ncbi:MAG: hypothetical protein RQ864_08650 [Lutibacter sp.]|nr:hypothetical protein [Lutibacter sp.]MDT8417861.1 hypothetical protein [Lutibacter sp.]
MDKKIKNTIKEILTYLSKFKDAKGNEPDVVIVAVLIEKYCNLYVEGLNNPKR